MLPAPRRAALAALVALAAPPAAAAGPALQAAGGEVVLTLRAGGARLAFVSGAQLDLELRPGARLSALAAAGTDWVAAGTEAGGTRLLLLAGDERRARRLPAPGGATPALRLEPVLLLAEGGLAGLAWLEGADRRSLGVRAAEWDGAGWHPTQEVAPPGPGSQLALAGTALADGSWLLLWSAFDGGDDEVVWSRRHRVSWSPPARVAADNRVPDITPAVLALDGGGALAAWSRYGGDGAYALQLARFDGRRWQAPEPLGPPALLYPSFVRDPQGAALLARSALPRGWLAVAFDEGGTPRRLAAVGAAAAERPLLRWDARGVRVAWPGRGEEATALWRPLP